MTAVAPLEGSEDIIVGTRPADARIAICGALDAEIAGRRVDPSPPGRKGRPAVRVSRRRP